MPSYFFLRRGLSSTLRKLYACLEKFLFLAAVWSSICFWGSMYSLLTVLRVVYAIVRLSSGKPPGIIFIFISKAKCPVGNIWVIIKHLNDMYFSRPIRFSCTLVCGPFKNLWFSCRRYFKVPLPIPLTASPPACWLCRLNLILPVLTIPPATQATYFSSSFLFQFYVLLLRMVFECLARFKVAFTMLSMAILAKEKCFAKVP